MLTAHRVRAAIAILRLARLIAPASVRGDVSGPDGRQLGTVCAIGTRERDILVAVHDAGQAAAEALQRLDA